MKSIGMIFVLIVLFNLSACQQFEPTPAAVLPAIKASETPRPEQEAAKPVITTALGDFVVVSARFVDEVNGDKPSAGEKILLVILSQPGQKRLDSDKFSLEAFQKMIHAPTTGEIYILTGDGFRAISTMGGWVNDEFAMGFRLPIAAKTYSLHWQGNPAIEIVPEDTTSTNK